MDVYKRIIETLQDADALVITASNGLSITEGLNLFASDLAFSNLFGDFQRKYGLYSLLEGCFYPFPTEEEKWAWWSRLIWHYSGTYTGSPVMKALKRLAQGKPHFIVTTNGEMHFELAGFAPEAIYEIEGSWKHMQCARGCHPELYPVMGLVRQMAEQQREGQVPAELVPRCPKCGAPMNIHMAVSKAFIPNAAAEERFQRFLEARHNQKLVVLELGVGPRSQMLKAPLMELVYREPRAFYLTFNKGQIYIPPQIGDKSMGVDGPLSDTFEKLMDVFGQGAEA